MSSVTTQQKILRKATRDLANIGSVMHTLKLPLFTTSSWPCWHATRAHMQTPKLSTRSAPDLGENSHTWSSKRCPPPEIKSARLFRPQLGAYSRHDNSPAEASYGTLDSTSTSYD